MPCLVLASSDPDETIYYLRKRILDVRTKLAGLGEPEPEVPEMIASTNLLRANMYLSKTNDTRAELVLLYERYSTALEGLLTSVFEIQNDLKDILKEQSKMIESTHSGASKPSDNTPVKKPTKKKTPKPPSSTPAKKSSTKKSAAKKVASKNKNGK